MAPFSFLFVSSQAGQSNTNSSMECENLMLLERENSLEMNIRKMFKDKNIFFKTECPASPSCTRCFYTQKKFECINTILAFLEPYNKITASQLLLCAHYKNKILEDFRFADNFIKYLISFYLENCFLSSQFLEKYIELHNLQHILNLLSDGRINVLTYYTSYVRKCIDSFRTEAIIEAQMQKYLEIFSQIPDFIKSFELTSENISQYEDIAYFLKVCCESNQTDSGKVTNLLEFIFKMQLNSTEVPFYIKHVDYDNNFLNYILHHCEIEGFELSQYVSKYCNTLWSYHSKLSVIDAAADGNIRSLLNLLNCGFEVYPEEEQQKCEYLSEKIPRHYQIILELMKKIEQKNMSEIGVPESHISEDQLNCFRIIWEETPAPDVTSKELFCSIKEEFQYFNARNSGILEINGRVVESETRMRELRRLATLFKRNFCVTTEREPCSLMKLCRISIRKCIRKALRCPDINQSLVSSYIQIYSRLESFKLQYNHLFKSI